jgi:hypothetical protein
MFAASDFNSNCNTQCHSIASGKSKRKWLQKKMPFRNNNQNPPTRLSSSANENVHRAWGKDEPEKSQSPWRNVRQCNEKSMNSIVCLHRFRNSNSRASKNGDLLESHSRLQRQKLAQNQIRKIKPESRDPPLPFESESLPSQPIAESWFGEWISGQIVGFLCFIGIFDRLWKIRAGNFFRGITSRRSSERVLHDDISARADGLTKGIWRMTFSSFVNSSIVGIVRTETNLHREIMWKG